MVLKRELTEVRDDDVCTVRLEVDGVGASSNADHEPEAAGTSSFHADEGVFENDGASRWSFETPGRFQEHVRRGLAPKTKPSKINAVYADVEELGEACRLENRRTVL